MNFYEAVRDSEEMDRLHEATRWRRVVRRWEEKHRVSAEIRWIEIEADRRIEDFRRWLVAAICGIKSR